MSSITKSLLTFLPKVLISEFVGRLARIYIPSPLRRLVLITFAKLNGVKIEEASRDLVEYRSVADFFTRELKSGAREIGEGFVSPVDGTLRGWGPILENKIESIKGRSYSVKKLLGETINHAEGFKSFLNFYLAPKDYHHIHAPIECNVLRWRFIPGTLWPVNNWAIQNVEDLFPSNSRVVLECDSIKGRLMIVFVGALNVGRIELRLGNESKILCGSTAQEGELSGGIKISKGERIGIFHLGSSVVLLSEEKLFESLELQSRAVKMGESLLRNF